MGWLADDDWNNRAMAEAAKPPLLKKKNCVVRLNSRLVFGGSIKNEMKRKENESNDRSNGLDI